MGQEKEPAERAEVLVEQSEADLHHAQDFLTTGHFILSGAFARYGALRALRAAAVSRGKVPPPRATVETLLRELKPPDEIAEACRSIASLPEENPKSIRHYVEVCQRVVHWATRAASS